MMICWTDSGSSIYFENPCDSLRYCHLYSVVQRHFFSVEACGRLNEAAAEVMHSSGLKDLEPNPTFSMVLQGPTADEAKEIKI